jgi:hypothetical protein
MVVNDRIKIHIPESKWNRAFRALMVLIDLLDVCVCVCVRVCVCGSVFEIGSKSVCCALYGYACVLKGSLSMWLVMQVIGIKVRLSPEDTKSVQAISPVPP